MEFPLRISISRRCRRSQLVCGTLLYGLCAWGALCSDVSAADRVPFDSSVSAFRAGSKSREPIGGDWSEFLFPPAPATIRFPTRPFGSPAVHPLRCIGLLNGDRLTGEILGGDADSVDVRLFGQTRLRFPLRLVDRISALPGERELVNTEFADPPQRIELPNCGTDFRCVIRLRVAPTDLKSTQPAGWIIRFSDGAQLRTNVDERGVWRTDVSPANSVPSTRQAVALRPGRHDFRLQRTAGRMFLSLNEQLLFAGPAAAGILQGIEFLGASLEVDHLSLVERTPETSAWEFPRKDAGAAAILGAQGEIWWGDLFTVGPGGVGWTAAQTGWRRSWRDLGGLVTPAAPETVRGRPLCGRVVRLDFQPSTDRPDLPGDRLTVSLGASRGTWIEADHPLLGRLVVPRAAIREATEQFAGTWQVLDAREIALGRAANSAALSGTVSCVELPRGPAFVSLDASGLEPAGPATPPGSPLLEALRAGRFATEVFLNDRRLGSINELTSVWSLPGRFDRLRLRLPADALKIGANTWRIQQQPGGGLRRQFDECRIRNLALEVEATLP